MGSLEFSFNPALPWASASECAARVAWSLVWCDAWDRAWLCVARAFYTAQFISQGTARIPENQAKTIQTRVARGYGIYSGALSEAFPNRPLGGLFSDLSPKPNCLQLCQQLVQGGPEWLSAGFQKEHTGSGCYKLWWPESRVNKNISLTSLFQDPHQTTCLGRCAVVW